MKLKDLIMKTDTTKEKLNTSREEALPMIIIREKQCFKVKICSHSFKLKDKIIIIIIIIHFNNNSILKLNNISNKTLLIIFKIINKLFRRVPKINSLR